MNKRYIDFVPTKKTKGEALQVSKKVTASKELSAPRKMVASVNTTTLKRTVISKKIASSPQREALPRSRKEPQEETHLGVVENLTTAQNIAKIDSDNKSMNKPKKEATKIFQVPKNPFINQGKVEKRPLSKNVYQKKIVVPKEEPKGPVTIISKPDKDTHVSLVVAVILTIILGAAAGTVAFLLLPK